MTDHNRIIQLLQELDDLLLDLLPGLDAAGWERQTVAREWNVKDVVAHLLDGNIRGLSLGRDRYFGEQPVITSYQDLVDFLNRLNAGWVCAMKRVSPAMLIDLHRQTGKAYVDYLATLDPDQPALFSVAWAGEDESLNRFHIAREYTEKWLHQQQIRAAIGDTTLLAATFFFPFIDIFMQALPYAYRDIVVAEGTTVAMEVSGEAGGIWTIGYSGSRWSFQEDVSQPADCHITLSPEIAWPLFSKSIRPGEIREGISVSGDAALAGAGLGMISVMA